MAIIITDTAQTPEQVISLPDDLLWSDEHKWVKVVSRVDYTLAGKIVEQKSSRVNGRPITLTPPDDSRGVITKQVLDDLYALADNPSAVITLTLKDGRVFPVIFDYTSTPISADQVYFLDSPPDDHIYHVTLKFMTR